MYVEAAEPNGLRVEDAWAIFRQQFPRGESIKSVTPWGGDRAVIVTDGGVYLTEADEAMGFRVIMILSR